MKENKLYEGKAKILFNTKNDNELIQFFKDSATAGNGEKKSEVSGKGKINNAISTHIFEYLEKHNIPTHFLKQIDEHSQLVKKLEIIPLEVIIRNKAAGSFCRRYKIAEGQEFTKPIIEFCLKDDELGDPFISEASLEALSISSTLDLNEIKKISFEINDLLTALFMSAGIELIDFKLEFGKSSESNFSKIVLADEISPDSARLWDCTTKEKMDKDRFRLDLGNFIEYYEIIAQKLKVEGFSV